MNKNLDSIIYFENSNWICPEKLKVELYELSLSFNSTIICTSNITKIQEIYIPEFNIGINNYKNGNKNYNIILNAHSRYEKGINMFCINDPVLLNTIILESDNCIELFDLLKQYIKSHHMESTINKLYELIK